MARGFVSEPEKHFHSGVTFCFNHRFDSRAVKFRPEVTLFAIRFCPTMRDVIRIAQGGKRMPLGAETWVEGAESQAQNGVVGYGRQWLATTPLGQVGEHGEGSA